MSITKKGEIEVSELVKLVLALIVFLFLLGLVWMGKEKIYNIIEMIFTKLGFG